MVGIGALELRKRRCWAWGSRIWGSRGFGVWAKIFMMGINAEDSNPSPLELFQVSDSISYKRFQDFLSGLCPPVGKLFNSRSLRALHPHPYLLPAKDRDWCGFLVFSFCLFAEFVVGGLGFEVRRCLKPGCSFSSVCRHSRLGQAAVCISAAILQEAGMQNSSRGCELESCMPSSIRVRLPPEGAAYDRHQGCSL